MSARTRLAIAVFFFAVWVSWLAYLAATTTRPVVLSRPQFLSADLAVVARLEADGERPSTEIEVLAVAWPIERRDLEGRRLTVPSLRELPPGGGWTGAGEYILPLVWRGEVMELAWTPSSPGYPHPGVDRAPPRLRIYRRTPETERQLATLQKG